MRPSEKFQTAFVFGQGIVKNKLINKGFLTILCSGFTYLFAYVCSACFLKDGVKMRNKLKCRR